MYWKGNDLFVELIYSLILRLMFLSGNLELCLVDYEKEESNAFHLLNFFDECAQYLFPQKKCIDSLLKLKNCRSFRKDKLGLIGQFSGFAL